MPTMNVSVNVINLRDASVKETRLTDAGAPSGGLSRTSRKLRQDYSERSAIPTDT